MLVYIVDSTHYLRVFANENQANKYAEEKNIELDEKYWNGYSTDCYGNKRIYVESHEIIEDTNESN